MKKFLFNISFLVLGIILFIIPCDINATTIYTNNNTTYEYFDDGTMLVTSITEELTNRSSGTKSAHKSQYYCDSNGNKLWSVTVSGTFTYTGSSSKCTKASVNTTVYNSDWKITNSTASHSGNSATATATAKKYYLSTIISTKPLSVTLSCDKNGNLS